MYHVPSMRHRCHPTHAWKSIRRACMIQLKSCREFVKLFVLGSSSHKFSAGAVICVHVHTHTHKHT